MSPQKLATSTLTASSAAVIAEFKEPTMGSMPTKPSVPFVAMRMEQMGATWMTDDVPRVKGELRG